MPKLVRVRSDMPATALLHPETGVLVVPDPSVPIPENDPLVKKFRWAFETDEEQAERITNTRTVTEVPLEAATRRPGEKRSTKRQ